MRKTSGLLARVFDVAMIVMGAMVATQIRFDDISQRSFFTALVAFSAALSLAMFPVLGVYASWRGRSKATLTGQVALGWIIVQMCVMALMFPLQHHIDFLSRLWFVYWTAAAGAAMIAGRLVMHGVLARVRHAGLNLQQVAVAGGGGHCHQSIRKRETAPGAGFRAAAAFNAQADAKIVTGVPVFEGH